MYIEFVELICIRKRVQLCNGCEQHIRERLLNTDANEHTFYIRLYMVIIPATTKLEQMFWPFILSKKTHVTSISVNCSN